MFCNVVKSIAVVTSQSRLVSVNDGRVVMSVTVDLVFKELPFTTPIFNCLK